MTGKCPECGEIKEITEQGEVVGMCDACYIKLRKCRVCGLMPNHDAWDWTYVEGLGSAHKYCVGEAVKE